MKTIFKRSSTNWSISPKQPKQSSPIQQKCIPLQSQFSQVQVTKPARSLYYQSNITKRNSLVVNKKDNNSESLKLPQIDSQQRNFPKQLSLKHIIQHNKSASLLYASRSEIGRKSNQVNKKHNQDHIIAFKNDNIRILGVLDGHGSNGHLVSNIVGQCLLTTIQDHIQKNTFILEHDKRFYMTILQNSFSEAENFLRNQNINIHASGSTATIALISNDNILYLAHSGDSRAILSRNGKAQVLTQDHNLDLPKEKQRILDRGGRIERYRDLEGKQVGPKRVWLPDLSGPGLAMTRVFGDQLGQQVGIISEPTINMMNLQVGDEFIVIASDGIWSYLSNEEVIDILKPFYLERKLNEGLNKLVECARQAWIENDVVIDDISCILLFIY